MNVKRFVGKNAREAIAQARGAWGDQTVVLSNRPIPGGVEILAMEGAEAPMHGQGALPAPGSGPGAPAALQNEPVTPMSTLSFQQFVRERQRRDVMQSATADGTPAPATPAASSVAATATPPARPAPVEPARFAVQALGQELGQPATPSVAAAGAVRAPLQAIAKVAATLASQSGGLAVGDDVMSELKSMRGMIATQLASMSWFDTVRRNPAQTQLLRLMLSNGFSPSLARQLVHRLPADCEETRATWWLLEVLAKNLHCSAEHSIANAGGVFALVGPTGVGKTTTCAKIAAHFSRQHGPASVGLITVDTYRMGASDQLRAFGRLMGIPVHTARDAASLSDLLDLFGSKKLVLIDTVGVAPRDPRLAELFAALPARAKRLLVLNASSQAEALEDAVQAYGGGAGSRVVISKLDEAVKCGAVVDVAIRHQLVVEGIANGQRVPEDWHEARAPLLVQKALMKQTPSIFTPDDTELGLMLTSPQEAIPARSGSRGETVLKDHRA
ncbi:MAG: flagellar biosynthesis protein FlhF [Burkholderiaceae bacterium]|nr:flagellar biosynthesis protein FlhF [Burkholderiaceae bacterium]